mgnify:CR=1 FL=1
MRRTLLLLLLLPLLALSKDKSSDGHIVVHTDVHCFKYQVAMSDLKDKYGEEPIFIGKSDLETGTVVMMFVNQQQGTYTVITTDKNIACILDVGNQVIYRMPKNLQSKMM